MNPAEQNSATTIEGAVSSAADWSYPKVRADHRGKLAVVYVRQSSPHQVLIHRESTLRQYALKDRARTLGWPAERVLVYDEDQAQSGRHAEHRADFQRLLTEVTMDHVGIVLALEASRLARSSKDWHHLIELCAVFQTLLADQDGVYDPNDPNDRLVLGLKGTMSEMEIFTMRNRLERGRRHKAERGELYYSAPRGYVKTPTGQLDFDPDEQAREVVRLVFDKFDELGTVYALMHYLVEQRIWLPTRPLSGPNRGQLQWRRPSHPSLINMLHHPFYAGAYAHGRPGPDPKAKAIQRAQSAQGAITSARTARRTEWKVLIRDRVPAYISWDRYLNNQERLKRNQSRHTSVGVARKGTALLGGLLICGTCGRRLEVSYRTKAKAHYSCNRHLLEAKERVCHGLIAKEIDALVVQQVLLALEPAALELSVKALNDAAAERRRLDGHWRRQLERARYDAELAERQYRAVDPDNRLVARTLEENWEKALRAQSQLHDEYDRFLQATPPKLTQTERDNIMALSSDIPALWHSPDTTNAERKEIIRCLVEKVVVQIDSQSEHASATILWAGGYVSQHEFVRTVHKYSQLLDGNRLKTRVVELHENGLAPAVIATTLTEEGFHPPHRGTFTAASVRAFLARLGARSRKAVENDQLADGEWRLADLAAELATTREKLRAWAARGWIHGYRASNGGNWILWADQDEQARLRHLLVKSRPGAKSFPAELTTPKLRLKAKKRRKN